MARRPVVEKNLLAASVNTATPCSHQACRAFKKQNKSRNESEMMKPEKLPAQEKSERLG